MSEKLHVVAKIEPDGSVHNVIGRDAWALKNLIEAGKRGCTPIEHPGPRWSHYVWKLRGMGFTIETIHEDHGGPFSGTHARYVLHSDVATDVWFGRAVGEDASSRFYISVSRQFVTVTPKSRRA